MRRIVTCALLALVCWTASATAVSATLRASRICTAIENFDPGRSTDKNGLARDERTDRPFARALAREYEKLAKAAEAPTASRAFRALASYYRTLAIARTTKQAVAIANTRYDEVSDLMAIVGEYVDTECPLDPTPTTIFAPNVEYDVGGNGRATVTFVDAAGREVTKSVKLPWYTEFPAAPGQHVKVSVTEETGKIVHCRILYQPQVDASYDVIASDAKSGDQVTAMCEGTT